MRPHEPHCKGGCRHNPCGPPALNGHSAQAGLRQSCAVVYMGWVTNQPNQHSEHHPERVRLAADVSPTARQRWRAAAAMAGITLNEYVARACDAYAAVAMQPETNDR